MDDIYTLKFPCARDALPFTECETQNRCEISPPSGEIPKLQCFFSSVCFQRRFAVTVFQLRAVHLEIKQSQHAAL